MATGGISLLLHDGSVLIIFIEFGMMLADEAALHSAYQFKGASGLKNCALCSNVFNWRSARDAVAADTTGISRYHTCCELRDLRLHTRATLTAIVKRLAAAAAAGMSRRNLEELETRLGFNYIPDGIMQDNVLRALADPTEHLLYDTMHIYYVNGIFGNHVGRLLEALKPHGITYATLRTYVSHWTWPSNVKKQSLTDPLEGKRAKSSWDDGVFKCTASEALSLMPVVAQFVEASVLAMASADARRHGACFMLLINVLQLIEKSARGATTPANLQRAIVAHLRTFKALYGDEWMPVKFHMSIHLPMFLQRWGFLPNCFVLERKHRVPKKYANDMRNTSGDWEKSVLRECTAAHFAELERNTTHFQAAACLIDAFAPKAAMLKTLLSALGVHHIPDAHHGIELTTARTARINEWETCAKQDVVLIKSGVDEFVAQIRFFVSIHDRAAAHDHTLAGVERWRKVAAGNRCSKWQRSVDDLKLVVVDEIACSLIWADSGGLASVLAPSRL